MFNLAVLRPVGRLPATAVKLCKSGAYTHTHTHARVHDGTSVNRVNEAWLVPRIREIVLTVIVLLALNTTTWAYSDPCGCGSYTTIGTNGNNTPISGYAPSAFAGCVIIQGTLVINVNYTLNGARLKMAEGSAIRVDETLTFTNSAASGCGDMWQGIQIFEGAALIIDNSLVEDAEFGISLGPATFLYCVNNDFINNYISITSGSPFDAFLQEKTVLMRLPIYGNDFTSDGALPDPYPGQHYYTSGWPTTPTGIPFNRPYAAIFLERTNGFNVGIDSDHSATPNTMSNLRNGIILYESTSTIQDCEMSSFLGGLPPEGMYNDDDHLLAMNSTGVLGVRSEVSIKDNDISGALRAINCRGSMLRALDNDITVPAVTPTLLRRSCGICATLTMATTIDNNTINEGYHGINVSSIFAPASITANTITQSHNEPFSAGIAVAFAETDVLVSTNNIDIENGSTQRGIEVNRVTGARVLSNDIEFTEQGSPTNSLGFCNGIRVTNCQLSIVNGNDITGSADYIENESSGIEYINSESNTLKCNEMIGMDRGVQIAGECTPTGVIASRLDDANYGLALVAPTGIGLQDHTGNVWVGDYDGFGAIIFAESSSEAEETALMSVFRVDASDGSGEPMPPSIFPPAIANDWFIDGSGEGISCPTSIDPPDNPISGDIVDLLNAAGFDLYSDEMDWMRKANAFRYALRDPDLLNNEDLEEFFEEYEVKPLGKLMQAEHAMGKMHGSFGSAREGYEADILRLSKDVEYIDSLLFLSPMDSADWIALRELKGDTMADVLNDWADALLSDLDDSHEAWEDAYEILDTLNTGLDLEEAVRVALFSTAKWRIADTLSTAELSDLEEVSELCPWFSGPGLAHAYGLYSVLAAVPGDFTFTCPEPDPFQGPQISIPQAAEDEPEVLTLYPVPVTDRLKIETSGPMTSITVTNAAGAAMVQQKLASQNFTLDVSQWTQGIYLISIQTASGLSLTEKFTITR